MGSVPNVVWVVSSCLLAQTVKSLEYRIGGLNRIYGSSHAHVMDDQQGSERFCWKLDVEYHKYIYCTVNN